MNDKEECLLNRRCGNFSMTFWDRFRFQDIELEINV
jgi:hypothetical protein